MRSMAFWTHVPMGPKDPILGVSEAFKASKDPNKINVGVGAYRDDQGKPWVLPSVRAAEAKIQGQDHEYAPIQGVDAFVAESMNLAYGPTSDAVTKKRLAAVQSLSGTGALRLSAGFISQNSPGGVKPTIYVPNPTWGNHFPIYEHSGLKTKAYRYWDQKTLGIDLKGLVEDLKNAPDGQVVLLHSCAHNPTGVDPTLPQWREISKVCKDKKHFVLFDNAYQGFASGNTDTDVAAVRMFIDEGHLIGLCQSFAKNFGLYGQRVGAFSILCENADEAARVESQVKIVARAMYSNPPLHGARIVHAVLSDPKLKAMWQGEIATMSNRIISMRKALKDGLKHAGSNRNWDHITNQIGMFSYTGLNADQCDALTQRHSVFLTRNGRISMAGVTSGNVGRLAAAIHDVTK